MTQGLSISYVSARADSVSKYLGLPGDTLCVYCAGSTKARKESYYPGCRVILWSDGYGGWDIRLRHFDTSHTSLLPDLKSLREVNAFLEELAMRRGIRPSQIRKSPSRKGK